MANTKRIDANFGGGGDSVFLRLSTGEFYTYEKNSEVLHELYGGKRYYWSCSGLSGAGFLQPEPGKNDLLPFGYYRTDAGYGHQHLVKVGRAGHREILGYVPIESHGGIQFDSPFVLTDSECVALLSQWSVRWALSNWEQVREKAVAKQDVFWTLESDRMVGSETVYWRLYNPDQLRGVNAMRFVDLRWVLERSERLYDNEPPRMCELLDLVNGKRYGDGSDCWLHSHPLGVFDQLVEVNPLMVTGPIGLGDWVGSKCKGMLWRRQNLNVQAMLELPMAVLAELYPAEGFTVPGLPVWVDFEIEMSVVDWYAKSEDEHYAWLLDQILAKARIQRDQKRPLVDLMAKLAVYRDLVVTRQNSLDAGNCEHGTDRFIDRFDLVQYLETGVTIGQLLDHPEFVRMVAWTEFQTLLSYMLNRVEKLAKHEEVMA